MRRDSLLPLSCVLLPLAILSAEGFRICSYNVQQFDAAKLQSYRAVHTLTKVAVRCNVILLQEVIDPDGSVIKKLLSSINRETHRYEGQVYKEVSSASLGKSPGDMQKYVFIYRNDTVKVVGEYQFPNKQQFARGPYVLQLEAPGTAIKKFVLVPLHSDPSRAVQEMDQLYDVFLDVVKKWKNQNVMFLGNFHAACAHMTRKDKKKIRLFSNTTFHWLIKDKLDTTVSEETNCAYDRMVVHGTPFLRAIQPFSANVFNVGRTFKIPQSQVLQLSDHQPIEVTLKSDSLLLRSITFVWLLTFVMVLQLLMVGL